MEKQRRKFITQLAGLSGLAAAPLIGRAATATSVKNIRLSSDSAGSRLVFDLDGPVDHKLFTLHNPERVVIDLKQTRLMNAGLIAPACRINMICVWYSTSKTNPSPAVF